MILLSEDGRGKELMFDLDRFFADCQAAAAADLSHRLVREAVAHAMSEPDAVLTALGAPKRAGINVIYRAPNLTVLNVIWGRGMTIMPYDHRMRAVIEDNIYWHRLPADGDREIEAAGARSLCRGDCTPLGPEIISSSRASVDAGVGQSSREPAAHLDVGNAACGVATKGQGPVAGRGVVERSGAGQYP